MGDVALELSPDAADNGGDGKIDDWDATVEVGMSSG